MPQLRAFAVLLCLGAPLRLGAEEPGGTLKKIKDSGVIALGHRESSIPFSYYDDKQQVVGYSQDIALRIVDAVKQELKLPGVQVKLVPVTSQNRIPLVQNGTVDIECGSTTNNLERQKQVAFSDTIFIVRTRLLTRKDSGIRDFPDLAGRNAVVTAGTTSERLLRKPDDWVVTGTPQSREAYGCSMRKDDKPFKAVVDRTISGLETSGEIVPIYEKWFLKPIPPKGLNLNFPLSDEMKALFKGPNDKAID